MFREDLFRELRKLKKEFPSVEPGQLKEVGTILRYAEKDIEDTTKYLVDYEKLFTKEIDITGEKFVGMLLVTWLTPFPGLLNLIFLWKNRPQRIRAIIALATGIAANICLAIVLDNLNPLKPAIGILFYLALQLWGIVIGLDVWMTMEAHGAYKRSKRLRDALWQKYSLLLIETIS